MRGAGRSVVAQLLILQKNIKGVVGAVARHHITTEMAFGSLFTVLFNFLISQEFRQGFEALPGGVWDPRHAENVEITAAIPLGYGQKYFEDTFKRVVLMSEQQTKPQLGQLAFEDSTQLAEAIFDRVNHQILTLKKDRLEELWQAMLTSTSTNSIQTDLSNSFLEEVEEVSAN